MGDVTCDENSPALFVSEYEKQFRRAAGRLQLVVAACKPARPRYQIAGNRRPPFSLPSTTS
jgi:hypothetical protein